MRIREGDEWKAAMLTGRGLFKPTVMFFGLCNSPSTLQRMMDEIFRFEINTRKVMIYMDDILITTETEEEGWEILKDILKKLRRCRLLIKLLKCEFMKPTVEYVGFIIGEGEVKVDPKKIDAVRNWPVPTTLKKVRGFIGFANFYRKFIPNFSTIAHPLAAKTNRK